MDSYEFNSFDSYDIEYDRGSYDDSDDEAVDDIPSPEEVAAFSMWSASRVSSVSLRQSWLPSPRPPRLTCPFR